MPLVSQNARLSKWKPEYSNLDIDATPDRYDTTGKLGSLPAGASQLDFDGALPANADNFTNTNADGFTIKNPIGVTQFKLNGQTSQYGIPGGASPINYFANTNADGFTLNAPYQVTQFKSNGQTSLLGFAAAEPSPVNYFANTNANGFTLKAQLGVSDFVGNGQTSLYGIPGGPTPVNYFANTNANGFTLNAPFQVTQFVGNGQTSQYGIPGGPTPVNYFANTNANGFTLRMPYQTTDFVGNGQTSLYGFAGARPSPVNYFADTNSAGFKLNAQIGVSDFVGNGQTSLYGFAAALPSPTNFFLNTNANGFTLNMPYQASDFVGNGQTSLYGFAGALPAPVNFFTDANSPGFTLQMPYQASNFVANGQTSIHGFAAALPSPTNFFLNTNAAGFTLQMPYQVSDFVGNGQTSLYGFAGALPSPVNYFANTNAAGFTLQMPYQVSDFVGNGQTSLYGFAGALPAPVDFFFNIYAGGFTLNAPYQVTQFLDPGNQSIYGFAGALPAPVDFFNNDHQPGFTLQAPYQVTQFVGNGQTSAYGFPGALPAPVNFFLNTNAGGFTLNAPYQSTLFVGNGQTSLYGFAAALPTPVNYFTNTNANGFTLNAPYQVTQFVGNGQTSLYGFASTLPTPVDFFYNENRTGFKLKVPYQVTYYVANGQTSRYGFNTPLPRPKSFFANTNAKGFTLKMPYQVTDFIANGQTSLYGFPSTLPTPVDFFDNKHRPGFKLQQPYQVSFYTANGQTSLYGFTGAMPTPVDFFYNFAAPGFTLRQPALTTKFVGASGGSYTYPSAVLGGRLMSVGQGPWVGGIAKLEAQLGAGSPKFGNKGWSTANKYAPSGTWPTLNAAGNLKVFSTTRRSPSPLDTAYSYSSYYGHNLKLRATAYNPSYINHPLILRGIQDGVEPQRWGTGTPLDGGGVRGGIVTAVERSAIDVARIGKILASPQGIIWNITQLGLGKSNPISEDPANRLRIGPTVLGSVATNAFGGHLPSTNLGPGYESIVKVKNLGTGPGPILGPNRLVTLANQLFNGGTIVDEFTGQLLKPVSGPGGPQSTYGIGFTSIFRKVNTRDKVKDPFTKPLTDRVGWAAGPLKPYKYYAGRLVASTGHLGQRVTDSRNADLNGVELGGLKSIIGDLENPGEHVIKLGYANQGVLSSTTVASRVHNTTLSEPSPFNESGNVFATLPYAQIKSIAAGRNAHPKLNNNFRDQVSGPAPANYTTQPVDYNGQSIEAAYGFGRAGEPGRDRSNPFVPLDSSGGGGTPNGDKINALNYQSNTPAGAYGLLKDFIYFYFKGPEIGSDEIIPFRATVKGISDSFNPTWNPVTIMGRPDSPAIYGGFERSVSFDFMVAAASREELVPMWRKLNYLGSFTMPLYSGNNRPNGPITRLTIGNMFDQVPGYITSLTISVNDEATWDISTEGGGKQLPNIVDVSCTFQIIHDYRPQKGGRVYSLYPNPVGDKGWLKEAKY